MEKSIIVFMTENQQKVEFITKLYTGWKELLDELEINHLVRQKFDGWFQKCYKERDCGRYQTLYEEFLRFEGAIGDEFLLKQEFEEIKRSSGNDIVQKAIDCVKHEKDLIQRHIEVQKQTVNKEHLMKLEDDVTTTRNLHKVIMMKLTLAQNTSKSLQEKEDAKDEFEKTLCGLNEVIKLKQPKESNGKILNKHQLESTIEEYKHNITKLTDELEKCKQVLLTSFCDVTNLIQDLVPRLEKEVKNWQVQYTLKYAELAPSPNLENIESWCADVGFIMYELKHTALDRWYEIFSGLWWTDQEKNLHGQIHTCLSNHLAVFIQRTFIVTDQDDFIVKTDKKHLPKIKVRVLALDKVDIKGVKICSVFAREEDINSCFNAQTLVLDRTKLNTMSHKMVQDKLTVIKDKKCRDKFEVTFDKLAFSGTFNRTTGDKKPFVHEEKYRVVFNGNIEGMELVTLSLPLVVTTGANQGCNALASVMWQCFSTDVFAFPIQNKPTLPWSDIARMLQAKMSKLSEVKQLSPKNINHLKRRLLGPYPDDEEVTLNKFCFDKMYKADSNEQHGFSFWKWFLANYNLLDKYLKQYWEDDLIGGFLSKHDVEEMFRNERIQKSGTFILRFSDNHINDSQGINSVFGYLTAMVSTRVDEDGEKKFKVISTEVADHKTLKDKNLANILRETQSKKRGQPVFQYLFPGNRSREDYFDKYCKEGTVVEGYRGRRDAFIVDLEQDMCALKISTGKHRRSSIDSGIDPSSPLSTCGGKRIKCSTETHPTIVNLLSNGSSVAGSPSNYSFISSPQASPAQHSPYSPAPSMSPTGSQALLERVSPAPTLIQSQLPVMVQNGFESPNDYCKTGFSTISTHDLGTISSSQTTSAVQQSDTTHSSLSPRENQSLQQNNVVVLAERSMQDDMTFNQNPANDTESFPYCGFADGSNPPITNPQCQEPNQLVSIMTHLSRVSPEIFHQLLSEILSKLPTEEIVVLQESCMSSQPSPAHPNVEMDNTPSDFVEQDQSDDFMLSHADFEACKQVNSGNIETNLLYSIADDHTNM